MCPRRLLALGTISILAALKDAAPPLEFEDTDGPGSDKQYFTFKVKTKPHIFPAFQLNHSCEDCE